MLFGRVPPVQKYFNRYDSYAYILAQLTAASLKISGPVDHKCISKVLQ